MMSTKNQINGNQTILRSMRDDVVLDDMLTLEPGERLWRLYSFHPESGHETHLEHRIYVKATSEGDLAMITFAVHSPQPDAQIRSGLARVPALAPSALDQIIQSIKAQTQVTPEEYLELDLSTISTLEEQLSALDRLGSKDTPHP